MMRLRCACFALVFGFGVVAGSQSAGVAQPDAAQAGGQKDPVLVHRPPAAPVSKVTAAGRMRLDVQVSDAAGKPVTGLEPMDFTILDDNQARKILSFRAFDSVQVKPDPPVEIVLVLDTMNTELSQVAIAREQMERFLKQNGGRLAQPVSILLLTGAGLQVQPRPSTDGNALVEVLNQVKAGVHTITSAMGGDGRVDRFQRSVKAMALIADNERKKPGRKVLVWIGPGWPLLRREDLVYSARRQQLNFDSIVSLSTKLREGRIVVYSLGGGEEFFYKDFLKGVRTEEQADPPELALPVLAIESGGRSVAVGNAAEMASQIDNCIAEARAFYMLSFDPPRAAHDNEYHDLKVVVNKPGLTARTSTGYYNQP
jgi:VWFA-related protein